VVSIIGVPPRARPHPALRKLGHRIRTLRTAKGWTQEDFAGEAGLDRSYASGLESGRRNPTYLRLLAVAKALNVSVQSLLDV
jgi:transcriptional regulator with XRE-family HTH domain